MKKIKSGFLKRRPLYLLPRIELRSDGAAPDVRELYAVALKEGADVEVARAEFVEQTDTTEVLQLLLRNLQGHALTKCQIQAELG